MNKKKKEHATKLYNSQHSPGFTLLHPTKKKKKTL
jgi:hypothetical protein